MVTSFRSACLQPKSDPNYVMSEDCLHLNVFVPVGASQANQKKVSAKKGKLAILLYLLFLDLKQGLFDPDVGSLSAELYITQLVASLRRGLLGPDSNLRTIQKYFFETIQCQSAHHLLNIINKLNVSLLLRCCFQSILE